MAHKHSLKLTLLANETFLVIILEVTGNTCHQLIEYLYLKGIHL